MSRTTRTIRTLSGLPPLYKRVVRRAHETSKVSEKSRDNFWDDEWEAQHGGFEFFQNFGKLGLWIFTFFTVLEFQEGSGVRRTRLIAGIHPIRED